ncbi:zinc transporter ZIP3-like [Acanthaster planci]|uniref:Zinc transporter ZIP3 n=1 Tax=Acanthaster planci TaxID=133434 RepID=A0A8B7ZIN6_ACAPL|nr:zinc transporter ZIP3-like [Acanthaster planci]XP_022105501.1 zinc transporter ZIP3-like [Acanthaster planci]XP_022105502.1 zinc transporter ZIP3-like [Acanthaster planci]XP_022105503.1 zinc transporter ZIP3-like [Acanthaster planci]
MDGNGTKSTLTDKLVTEAPGSPYSLSMTILILQLLSMVTVFLITLAGALLPLKVIGRKATQSIKRRQRSEKILSYCNCLAGGVFLATCFLGLIPAAREKFHQIFQEKKINVDYPFCEAAVVLGFFLILTLEQLALSLQQQWNSRNKVSEIQMKKVSIKFSAQDGKVKADTTDLEDSEEDEDLFDRDSDRRPMLGSSRGDAEARNGGHRRVNAAQTNETGDGDVEPGDHSHGHSHLSNINNSGLLRSLILLFALSTHSVFEGMALGLQENVKRILYLLIAMLAHESLAAFALGASLIKNSVNTYAFVIYGVVFAGMIPSGIALGLWIRASRGFGAIICSAIMQAVAAGIFIFVTFFEILNHEFEVHRNRPQKIAFAVIGYVILALLEAVG